MGIVNLASNFRITVACFTADINELEGRHFSELTTSIFNIKLSEPSGKAETMFTKCGDVTEPEDILAINASMLFLTTFCTVGSKRGYILNNLYYFLSFWV